MRIAITGSSGLIGTSLVKRLEDAGHTVVRIVRSNAGPNDALWDPAGGTIDAAALEGLDAVVHLAGEGIGEKRWTDAQKAKMLDSRVDGTDLLATTLAGLKDKPKVLLSGSAIGLYGDRGDQVLTEASTAGSGFLADLCIAWEAATAPAEQAGIRVCHLRTGIVISPDGGALQKLLLQFKLFAGGKMGSGRQYWSWISLDDEVDAIVFLLDADVTGPVNLTAPAPVTNARFTKVLGKVLKRPAILPVPKFGPKLLIGSELADSLLFFSARVQPEVLLQAGHTFRHLDIEVALRAMLER